MILENKLKAENSIQPDFKSNCKPYQKNPHQKVMQIYDFNIYVAINYVKLWLV